MDQQMDKMLKKNLSFQCSANDEEIEKFQGKKNYKSWVNNVKQWAASAGFSDILELKPENVTEDQKLRVALVKTKILSTIDSDLHDVLEFETPLELLNELEKRFDQPSFWDKAKLFDEFIKLKMKPNEDLEMFILKFDSKYEKLLDNGISLEDSVLSYQLLRCLPSFLNSTRKDILNNFACSRTATYEEIKENLRKMTIEKHVGNKKSVENVQKKKKIKCFKCGGIDHIKKFCPVKLEKKTAENKSHEEKNAKQTMSNCTHQVDQESSIDEQQLNGQVPFEKLSLNDETGKEMDQFVKQHVQLCKQLLNEYLDKKKSKR